MDAQGEVRHTFGLDANLGNKIVAGRLTVEGAVRDDRGKYVAGAASADFVAVDRLVGLHSTEWVFREDEPANVEYLVVDSRGAPTAGTRVSIRIERLETKAARLRGAGTAYLTEFIDEWFPAGECENISTTAALMCCFRTDRDTRPLSAHCNGSRHARSAAYHHAQYVRCWQRPTRGGAAATTTRSSSCPSKQRYGDRRHRALSRAEPVPGRAGPGHGSNVTVC